MQIREAKKEDCPRLMELVNELALFEKAPEEVDVTMEEFIDAGFGDKPVWKAFVAEIEGTIAGFALYYVRYSTWKGRRIYLEDLIVTESMRGRGIGKVLLERVIKEAYDLNFNGLTWQVLDWNQPAIDFYQKYQAAIDSGWLNVSLSKEQVRAFKG